MNDRAPPFSLRRFRFAWKLFKSSRAAAKGEFDRAIQLLDKAGELVPLRASDRVDRAMLLLGAQRIPEAHEALARLRDEFKGSDDPDLRYLRHFCTSQLSLLMRSGQWSYEAKQAKLIRCSAFLKGRFPMTTVDEIHDRIQPRR
jgi:hypothetical protein